MTQRFPSIPAAPPALAPKATFGITTVAHALTSFHAFAWCAPTSPLAHVTPMYRPTGNPQTDAAALAKIPAGQRAVCWQNVSNSMWGNAADVLTGSDGKSYQSPWVDAGAAALKQTIATWVNAVKAAGGIIDFWVLDDENGVGYWQPGIDPAWLAAITADPRFVAPAAPFGLSANAVITQGNWQQYNATVGAIKNGYLRSSILAPLQAAFPGAGMSNWGDCITPNGMLAPDYNGWSYANSAETIAGTVQSPYFYGWVGQLALAGRNDGTNPDFSASPMPTLIWQTDCARAYRASGKPSLPWLSAPSWSIAGYICALANTPYVIEAHYHALMALGVTSLLSFNPNEDVSAVDAALADLQKQCDGFSSFEPIALAPTAYDATTLVSGIRLPNGREVYRVTVGPVQSAASVTLANGKTQTVQIPSGQVGAWVMP